MSQTFRHAHGWSATFAAEVLGRFDALLRPDLECGGVLLGNRFLESPDILIKDLTEPQGADRRGPARFFRSEIAHQRLVDRAWRDSQGELVYLGEWHTHTAGGPTPSQTDKLTYARFAREAAVLPLAFVIVTPGGIAVWGTAEKGTLAPLVPFEPGHG